ncbi:hypothetical protein Bca4012_066377 [Brassica carinata]
MASPSDQTAKIIDGKAIAHTIRAEIAEKVRHLSEKHGKVPGLAVVIVIELDLQLAMKGREPLFLPCTPKGCLELLVRSGIKIKGQRAVVVGRSNIVGLPVSLLLIKAYATVTTVHSHAKYPEAIIKEADIIIAAAGQACRIKGDWIKPGDAVIDVGRN